MQQRRGQPVRGRGIRRRPRRRRPPRVGAASPAAAGSIGPLDDAVTVRFGVFPNITHAPGLVALADDGPLKKLLPNADIQVKQFSSGTPASEAILSDALDITYIGPNPAINMFAKTNGEAVRVISGSTSGGAFLVVKPEITSAADLKGKKIATPRPRQHPGRRAPLVAQAAGAHHRHRRRRRRLGRAAGQRADARDVPGRDDRRRLGARAVGDAPHPGGRRQGPRRRARPVARRQVRHDPPARGARSSSTPTPRSSSGSCSRTSRRSTR